MTAYTPNFAIHNHLNPRDAMYVRVPKPTFRTTKEKDAYWGEQERRWIEGYSGLTGLHYFYIQECLIPNAKGRPIRPRWRDGDQFIAEAYRDAYKDKKDLFVLKRREFGLSSFFGGAAPIYHAMLEPGSSSFLTSVDKQRIEVLFHQKLMTVYANMDPDIKSPQSRRKQSGYLFLAEEVKRGVFSGLQSEIHCKETVKNPQAAEAYRLVYMFLDELFLHKRAADVRASALRCFSDGTDKIGTIVMGGSCGIGTTAGIEEGKKIYLTSADSGIMTVFIPGWMNLSQFETNGWSDEKRGYEWCMGKRKEFEKNPKLYFKEIADYPLTEEEILNMVDDSVLPEEIQIMLKQSQRRITESHFQDTPHRIERGGENGELRAIPDPAGKFHIIIPPRAGHPYGAGIDPIPFGNAALDENKNSKLALIIKDRLTQEHVAYYMERNMDINTVFHNCTLLLDLYGGPRALLELNRGEALYIKFMEMGRLDLMAYMPTELGIKFEKRKYPHGVAKNNKVEERCNHFWYMYLYANADKMVMRVLIDETMNWTKINHDLLDAALMEIIDHANLLKIARKPNKGTVVTKTLTYYRDAQGRTHKKLVEKQVRIGAKTMEEVMKGNIRIGSGISDDKLPPSQKN